MEQDENNDGGDDTVGDIICERVENSGQSCVNCIYVRERLTDR